MSVAKPNCISHYQGCNCSRDNGRGRGNCASPKWRRKCISAISNFLPAEKGEEGWERLQQGKQHLQGSSFPFTAGSELTGSASKNVTQLGHFVCYCWDMREAAVRLATDPPSCCPLSQTGSLVWCREPAERTFFSFAFESTSGVVSLLLTELIRKGQERNENHRLSRKETGQFHHVQDEPKRTA